VFAVWQLGLYRTPLDGPFKQAKNGPSQMRRSASLARMHTRGGSSGVARGSAALGQGALTAPPEKSFKICPFRHKKLVLIPQNF